MKENCANPENEQVIRRRIHSYHFEVEKDIYATMMKIERLDADEHLTNAIVLLQDALKEVGDYYDKKLKQMYNDK